MSLLLPMLLFGSPAVASPQLQWSWPAGLVRTYYLESLVMVPSPWTLSLWGMQGTARTSKVRTSVVIRCTTVDELERSWELSCAVEDAALVAAPVSGERPEVLERIMVHYGEALKGAELQLVIGKDGRLRGVDLEGLSKQDRVQSSGQEWVRQLLRRALSGMDLSAPPPGEELWIQKDHPWSDSPYGSSAPGSLRLRHESWGAPLATELRTVGHGTVSIPIGGYAPDSLTPPTSTWSMRVVATGTFQDGALRERMWGAVAEPTASVGVITGQPYMQGGYLRLIPVNEALPDCGESGLWEQLWSSSYSDHGLAMVGESEPGGYHEAGFRSEPYLWASLGPTWHVQHLRQNVEGLSGTVGVRLPLALSLGAGVQVDRLTSFRYLGWPVLERQAFAGVWYESNYTLSPRMGVLGGAAYRSFPGQGIEAVLMPFVALDFSLLWRLRPDSWIGLHGRAPVELGHLLVSDSQGNELWIDNTSLVVSVAWTQKISGRGKSPKVTRATTIDQIDRVLEEASIPQAELLSAPTE